MKERFLVGVMLIAILTLAIGSFMAMSVSEHSMDGGCALSSMMQASDCAGSYIVHYQNHVRSLLSVFQSLPVMVILVAVLISILVDRWRYFLHDLLMSGYRVAMRRCFRENPLIRFKAQVSMVEWLVLHYQYDRKV